MQACHKVHLNLFQKLVFLGTISILLSCIEAEILTRVQTVSSNSSAEIYFDETLLDPASLAYRFVFKTNDTSSLVLNISALSAEDYGGAKILIAVKNFNENNYDRSPPSIGNWLSMKVFSWSGPCTGGSLLTSNNTQIHVIIYQLIRLARFSFRAIVCASSPCVPQKVARSTSPYTCLPDSKGQISPVAQRAFHSLVSVGDCYYAFGGVSSISSFDDLPSLYSTVSQGDCSKGPLKDGLFKASQRYLASIVPGPSRIFVIGGVGSDLSPINDSAGYISFDSSSTKVSWSPMPALYLFGHAACAYSASRVFVYGGSTSNGIGSSMLMEWRQKWSAWRKVTAWYGSPPPPLIGHSLTCSSESSKLYVFGGFSLSPASRIVMNPTIYAFDVIIKRWAPVIMIEPRFFHSAALLPAKVATTGELTSGSIVFTVVGGRQRTKDVTSGVVMVDTRCQSLMRVDASSSFQKSIGAGTALAVAPLPSEPYFRLLSSGGMVPFNGTSFSDVNPYDLKIKLPTVSQLCANDPSKTADNSIQYWRCGLALNPNVYFITNSSRYFYDLYIANSNDLATFLDIDILANKLSPVTSKTVEWTVQCRGWLRLDSSNTLSLAAASSFDDGTIDKKNLNFRFAIYLFVDGGLIQSYLPSGKTSSPSLPLIDPDDNTIQGIGGNGIFQVTLFLHGLGPIIPNGYNIQLQSSTTGATYLMPTAMLSTVAAEFSCNLPSAQVSCVACLLNAACSWVPGKPAGSCVARRFEMPTADSDDDAVSSDVIRDPAACPSCFQSSTTCGDCTTVSPTCSWIPGLDVCLSEVVTYTIPEATQICSKPCSSRKSCSACTDDADHNSCLWCPSSSVCIDYWLAEAGIPAATGCTLGCEIPDATVPTTPSGPSTSTVCADDNSWCGPPNEICLAMMTAGSLVDTSASTLPLNPIDAFPLMRDDDGSSNMTTDDLPPAPPPLDARLALLSSINAAMVCSGHGHCIPPGRCLCDPFWQGDSCQRECRCFGDGKCIDPIRSDVCLCPAGTTGSLCERCISGYTGNPKSGVPCRSCYQACNKNADTCVSLQAAKQQNLTNTSQLAVASKSLPIAEQDSDIYCIGCRDNTYGDRCQSCTPGYFRPMFFGRYDPDAKCQRCTCNGHSNLCNEAGGFGCQCEDNTRTAPGAPNSMGCGSCTPPFLGDPRNGRPCYLPVSQNQQLCLWQDAVPYLAAKLVAAANSSDSSNLCRHVRDSVLMPSTSMHLASQVPLTNELRIFIGVVTGKVDIVMTLNPSSLRPAPKGSPSSFGSSSDMVRRARAATSQVLTRTGNSYDNIAEALAVQNTQRDNQGDSIVQIQRSQLTGAPVAVRGVSGRLLIVISPPSDRLKQDDLGDSLDVSQNQNQAIYVHLRITAVSSATIRNVSINDDRYYSVTASDMFTGEAAAGVIVFRQDQVQIDVFVFFSVFLALFVLLLLGLLLVIRFHAVLTERRRLQARQQRKKAMIRRPFGVAWPRFDLPLLMNPATKLPMTLADLFLGPIGSDATPRSVSIAQPAKPPAKQANRRTATVVSLQPTANNRAAITTVLIKLPVARPVLRQMSTASGFNVNEQTAIVTQVPPSPMAFGTLIMRVIVQEQKKTNTGHKVRPASPVKPGRLPAFERDPTDELMLDERPIVPPLFHSNASSASMGQNGTRRNSLATATYSRNTPSSITLPPTPDTIISSRSGGDDLEETIDEILASAGTSNVGRRVMGARRRGPLGGAAVADVNNNNNNNNNNNTSNQNNNNKKVRPFAAPANRPTAAVTKASQQTLAAPSLRAPSISRDISLSTAMTSNTSDATPPSTGRTDDVLIPELPDTNASTNGNNNRRGNTSKRGGGGGGGAPTIFGRGRAGVLAAALAQRPPLPPTARQKTALSRRQSVPSQSQTTHNNNQRQSNAIMAPNFIHQEEDAAI